MSERDDCQVEPPGLLHPTSIGGRGHGPMRSSGEVNPTGPTVMERLAETEHQLVALRKEILSVLNELGGRLTDLERRMG